MRLFAKLAIDGSLEAVTSPPPCCVPDNVLGGRSYTKEAVLCSSFRGSLGQGEARSHDITCDQEHDIAGGDYGEGKYPHPRNNSSISNQL